MSGSGACKRASSREHSRFLAWTAGSTAATFHRTEQQRVCQPATACARSPQPRPGAGRAARNPSNPPEVICCLLPSEQVHAMLDALLTCKCGRPSPAGTQGCLQDRKAVHHQHRRSPDSLCRRAEQAAAQLVCLAACPSPQGPGRSPQTVTPGPASFNAHPLSMPTALHPSPTQAPLLRRTWSPWALASGRRCAGALQPLLGPRARCGVARA